MNRTSEMEHILICLKEHIALSDDEDNLLLDYITNLQQENERLKDNWNYIKKMFKEARQEKYISDYCGTCHDVDIDFLLGKMQELQGSDSDE